MKRDQKEVCNKICRLDLGKTFNLFEMFIFCWNQSVPMLDESHQIPFKQHMHTYTRAHTYTCFEQHLRVAPDTASPISWVSSLLWELSNIVYGTFDARDSNMVNPPFPACHPSMPRRAKGCVNRDRGGGRRGPCMFQEMDSCSHFQHSSLVRHPPKSDYDGW